MRSYLASSQPGHAARDKRHAVHPDTLYLGLDRPEAECLRPVRLDVGPWEPGHPSNCAKCEKAAAGGAAPTA